MSNKKYGAYTKAPKKSVGKKKAAGRYSLMQPGVDACPSQRTRHAAKPAGVPA